MRKVLVLVAVLTATLSSNVYAQALSQDYWVMKGECPRAVQTGNFRFYYPSAARPRALASNERVAGHPTGGCFHMVLPDRAGGRGWVAIEAGRPFVYREVSPGNWVPVRLAECNNDTDDFESFLNSPQPATPTVQPVNGAVDLRSEPLNGTIEVNHRFPDTLKIDVESNPSTQKVEAAAKAESESKGDGRSWLGHNWPWLVAGAAVGVGTYALAHNDWKFYRERCPVRCCNTCGR